MTKNILIPTILLTASLIFGGCTPAVPNQAPINSTPTSITNDPQSSYICPQSEWVNCMPGPGAGERPQCDPDFLEWAKANCPNFQGAAY